MACYLLDEASLFLFLLNTDYHHTHIFAFQDGKIWDDLEKSTSCPLPSAGTCVVSLQCCPSYWIQRNWGLPVIFLKHQLIKHQELRGANDLGEMTTTLVAFKGVK